MTTAAWVVSADRPAAADQVANLRTRARVISQQLVADQLQADAYQQQYSVASAKVASDNRQIALLDQQIGVDQQQMAAETRTVRQLVITTYMNGGSDLSHSDTAVFSDNVEQAQVVDEYAGIAAGNIDNTLDQLEGEQRVLQAQQLTLQQQQAQDQSTQQQQAAALSQADATTTQLQSLQSQVTGQLAAAVAGQADAARAAAQAALAAARRHGVSGGAAVAAAAAPSTALASLPDPALNPFLQCVVRVESGGNYQAVSPNGQYMGAFQFSQATWNMAARAAGLPGLVGVRPNRATKAEQDTVAVALYALDGHQPWLGDRCAS